TVNGLTIYLDGDVLYVTGEDDQGGQRWNDANINSTQIPSGAVNIVPGQTYHVAFVYNAATDSFSGYLDGVLMNSVGTDGAANFPSHSGDIGIGGVNGGVQFHDGENNTGNGFNFAGRISDVAIYNRALSVSELSDHANSLEGTTSLVSLNREYNAILEQIDRLVVDAQYRGINLLGGEDLTTFFNEDNTSFLVTEGQDFTWQSLGLLDREFDSLASIQNIFDRIRPAILKVRDFGRTLTNDLGVINNRRDFTDETIIALRGGADDLTLLDQNQEGASLLAGQTRLELATTSLSLAAQSQASTLTLFE
ncbi:MAG: LamG-like jellyroll fold domain-containing protein, partial [Bdellovibrionales bacterium]